MTSMGTQRLTMALIKQCALLETDDTSDRDKVADQLLETKVLRLDWQNIQRIENLDAFTSIRELYLQHNCIEKIENLDFHFDLEFLSLSNNQIKQVTNLSHLKSLRFLDLSQNAIESLSLDQLPPSLMILRLEGNPCASAQLNSSLFEAMPNLIQIDQERRDGMEIPATTVETDDNNTESDPITSELIEELEKKKAELLDSCVSELNHENKEALNIALDKLHDRKEKMIQRIRERTREEIKMSKERCQHPQESFENWKKCN